MPKLIMLVGLPGSGKSVLAKQISKTENADIFSSDQIREELCNNVNEQKLNNEVFQILHKRIKENLSKGNNSIYDATNISYKRRKDFLSQLNKINCYKKCIVVATPFEICQMQNNNRERIVPDYVINNMYKKFDIPYFYEGWDEIKLHYINDNYKNIYGNINTLINDYLEYDQNNEHHKLTLGNHLLKTKEYIEKYYDTSDTSISSKTLKIAAILHDSGKPYCKTYKDKKGNIDKNAHYYGHEHVGSYNSLFYETEDNYNKLLVATLIRWHMQMHYIKKESHAEDKYKFLLGNLWSGLELLNKADIAAH